VPPVDTTLCVHMSKYALTPGTIPFKSVAKGPVKVLTAPVVICVDVTPAELSTAAMVDAPEIDG